MQQEFKKLFWLMLLHHANGIIKAAFIFTIVFITACSTKPAAVKHSENSFEEEYPDGNLKKECKFLETINDNHHKHHCRLYHPNGNLAEEGDFINDTIATGWHTYYRVSGSRKARREYLELSPIQIYLNQVIRFEINGDTDKTFSNYYSIYFDKDTVNEGDYLIAHFNLVAPYFKESYISVTIKNENGEDEMLPDNYSRIEHQAIKTVHNGNCEIKGKIEEIEKLEQKGDTIKVRKRPLYFSKIYYVK